LLVGFIGSNCVGDLDDQKCIVYYDYILGSKPIVWDWKKQCVLALSLVEAKCWEHLMQVKQSCGFDRVLEFAI
jgi:hypothetical protein